MKIVCEACQAKYSIADDKVRGKVFKIRCKKCSHVIVVRGSGDGAAAASGEFATSPASATDLTLDAGWHIVVEGEQVGPLSEADIKARLTRGEVSPDTYIWKEGLADWVKISTLPEFSDAAPASAPEANPFAGGNGALFGNQPTNVVEPSRDVFAPQSAASGQRPGDLFAAPVNQPVEPATSVNGGGGYGGYDPGPSPGAQGGGLTGQRHENSVLFSLSNLEALAKPNSAPLPAARSSAPANQNTEGSGLIDIRAMANMTLGGQAANRPNQGTADLPAFSAPQFSPVAPVLLSPSNSPPKWIIGLLVALGAVTVGLVVVSVKMFSDKPAPVAVTPPPAAVAPTGAKKPAAPGVPGAAGAAGTATAAAPAAPAATPPSTPPPPAEALPPREAPRAAADRPAPSRTGRAGGKPPRGGRGLDDALASRLAGVQNPPPARPAPAAPKQPKDELDALLEAASGGRKPAAAAAARNDDPEPAPRAEKGPPLGIQDINRGMMGVLPKARECYSQFKVPGVANAKITVDPRGRVTEVSVTGKFAGTPSGGCVESAIKGAKFSPSAGLTFNYPVPLR